MTTTTMRTTRRADRRALLGAALLGVALAGCGDGGTGPDLTQVASIVVESPRTLIAVGETVQLTATAYDANGTALARVPFTWSSDGPALQVSASGEAKGAALGTAFVTATAGTKVGKLGIVVNATGQAAAEVTMQPNSFTPTSLEIRVNERVAFVFPALAHNVIFDKPRTGVPADIPQTVNQTVQRLFTTAGTFPYACTLHPGMVGQIVVRP